MQDNWISIVGVIVALVALVGGAWLVLARSSKGKHAGRHASTRPSRETFREPGHAAPPPKRVAVVINPTKFDDLDATRAVVSRAATQLGWAEPEFAETTEEDPGFGQTRAALERKVDLVCALGGDGTVRAVAEVMAGSGVPMGLLPGGTGNLLARNLTVPLTDLDHAVEVALTGRNRRVDIGWVTVDPTQEQVEGHRAVPSPEHHHLFRRRGDHGDPSQSTQPGQQGQQGQPSQPSRPSQSGQTAQTADQGEPSTPTAESTQDADITPELAASPPPRNRHAFVVMAGIGFDAQVMEETSEELKAKVGWTAYVASGMGQLVGTRFRANVSLDDGDPMPHRARSVLAGNCGVLTGGIPLMPDAQIDDGILDIAVIKPKGLIGWASMSAHVLTRRERDHRAIDRDRAPRLTVAVDEPQPVEVDGDVIGTATTVIMEVEPRALILRVGTENPQAREEVAPDTLAQTAG